MRDVTLKQLRYLTATIRTGSLVGAAAELHLTAPAVAAQLRFLEKSIGLTLLERGPGGQRATEAGRLLMYTGARIEAELAACDDAVSALRSAHVGRVSLGAVSTAKYFAPHVLASFQREHPDISVTLSIGNRDEVLARLEGYDVDLAVMGRAPVRIEAEQEEFGEHPYVIIAAPDHSLVQQHEIPFAKIATETFLMRESGSGTRLHLEALFASAGVLAGLGLALISAHTIAAEVQDGRLAILDVVGLPIRRKWLVVRMSRRALSPATQALWDFFRTEGSRQLPTVGH
jgi:DNA-binding transcriptional LysR family regulator